MGGCTGSTLTITSKDYILPTDDPLKHTQLKIAQFKTSHARLFVSLYVLTL